MFERLRKPVSALLAVTLAAGCAFPWYAWADDLSEVSNGYEDDRGTGSGDSGAAGPLGGAQSETGGQDTAGAQEVAPGAEAGYSPGGGSGVSDADTVDGSSEDEYLYSPGGGFDSGSDELGDGSDEVSGSLDSDISSGDSGVSGDQLLEESELDTEVQPRAVQAIMGWLAASGVAAAVVDGIFSVITAGADNASTKQIALLNGLGYWTYESYKILKQEQVNTNGIWTSLGTKGTIATKLDTLINYNKETYYDGYTYSTAKYLAFIFREADRINQKLLYSGSLVGGDTGDYSAARLLARVHNALYGSVTYAETGKTDVRSAVGVLGYLANLTYYNGQKLNGIRANTQYQGTLNGTSVEDNWSTARLLARLFNMNYQEVTYSETGTTAYRSTAGILGYIANSIWDERLKLNEIRSELKYQGTLNGSSVEDVWSAARLLARLYNLNYQEVTLHETGGTAYRSTAGLLGYIANLTYDTQYANGTYIETGNSGKRSLADMLLYVANLSYLSKERLNDVAGYLVSESSMVSKGFADLLAKLDGLTVDAEVSVDMSGVESRLDAIAALLALAGAKDLLDDLIGSFDGAASSAAAAAVSSAIQSAFPFCVPAMVKQVLGLLDAEAAPPSFDFEILGAPMHLDFSRWSGLADMTCWFSRITFTVYLLGVSRRFIFVGGLGND